MLNKGLFKAHVLFNHNPSKGSPRVAFTGLLRIAADEIETNEDPAKTMAQGVLVIWSAGVTTQTLRNTIDNGLRNSIEVGDSYMAKMLARVKLRGSLSIRMGSSADRKAE